MYNIHDSFLLAIVVQLTGIITILLFFLREKKGEKITFYVKVYERGLLL